MSMHIANGMFGAVIIDPTDLDKVDHEYVMVASELYLGADGQPADASLLSALQPNAMAFNGVPLPVQGAPDPDQDQRARARVGHGRGPEPGDHLPRGGHPVRHRVARGRLHDPRRRVRAAAGAEVLTLGAAEGGFVEFTPLEAGHYSFVNHALSLAERARSASSR